MNPFSKTPLKLTNNYLSQFLVFLIFTSPCLSACSFFDDEEEIEVTFSSAKCDAEDIRIVLNPIEVDGDLYGVEACIYCGQEVLNDADVEISYEFGLFGATLNKKTDAEGKVKYQQRTPIKSEGYVLFTVKGRDGEKKAEYEIKSDE